MIKKYGRIVALGLAVLISFSSLGTLQTYAEATADTQRTEEQQDEKVTADDIVKDISDASFDIKTSKEGIQYNADKEDVVLSSVKAEDGSEYDSCKAGVYYASYQVIPKDKSDAYIITRKITLTDTEGQAYSEKNGGEKQKSDTQSGDADDDFSDGNDEEKTINNSQLIATYASSSGKLVTGDRIDYPAAFNAGGFTNWFWVNGHIAYCLEADIDTPSSGTYPVSVSNNEFLQKVLYYGYGGPGDITGSVLSGKTDAEKYVYTHIAASYANLGNSDRAFYGCNYDGLKSAGVLSYIEMLKGQRTPPLADLSLSTENPKVTIDGKVRKTENITLKGDGRNQVTITVPDNVTVYNVTKNTEKTGGDLIISGGDSFYLTTDLDNKGTYTSNALTGSVTGDWKVLVVRTTTSDRRVQDIGTFEAGETGDSVSFNVDLYDEAQVKLTKTDSKTKHPLKGAVYGVYKTKECKESDLLVKMTTGDDGTAASGMFDITGLSSGTVYVKEITAPDNYLKDSTVHEMSVTDGQTANLKLTDEQQKGEFHLYKSGEGLMLAQPTAMTEHAEGEKTTGKQAEDGTGIYHEFQYTNGKRVAGVEFELYAKDTIYAPDGSGDVLYEKDQLVTTLTTDKTGYAEAKDLPLGTYYLKEVKAGTNYVLNTEQKEITIAQNPNAAENPATIETVDYTNDRQKVKVSLEKEDAVTKESLEGVIFGLYTAEDISSDDGGVYVEKNTLLEKKATDKDGKLTFDSELPNGKYYVKEEVGLAGYVPGTEVWDIDASYTDQTIPAIEVSHTFENQPTVTEITKTDATTGEELEGAKLQVIDEKGNVVEEWTSTKEKHVIYGLAVGTYTLHEEMPPYAQGYVSAQDATFEVKEDGTVTKVEMKDEYSNVEVFKTDSTTGKELKGAKLQILNKDGKVLEEWVSDGSAHVIKKLPVKEELTLHEVSAPKGYEVADDIVFTLKDTTEVQKIEMKDAQTEIKTVLQKTSNSPKTGDTQNIWMFIMICIMSLGIASGLIIYCKKK